MLHNWTVADENIVPNGGKGDRCPRNECTVIDQFSAACWYFAQSLTDRMKATDDVVPLGMIESAYGGTTIEQWLSVDSQLQCSNVSCHANSSNPYSKSTAEECTKDSEMGNGGLYNGMVAPFVNMTMAGFVWYQGENNLFADAGNVIDRAGYACLLKQQMETWRDVWSAVEYTTSPKASFGIVTLVSMPCRALRACR